MLSTTIIDTPSWHQALKQLLHVMLRSFNLNLRRLTLDAVVSFFICSSQSRKSSKASLRQNRNKYNKIQIKTYLQNTVGRNFFCSVWKSFSLSSLGSTFAVTLVENLGHSKYYHCGCRCLRLKYRQSLFHCYNHFLSPLMFGYGNVGWAIKVDCRWIDSRYIDYRHIAKYWFVDMSTVYLSQDCHHQKFQNPIHRQHHCYFTFTLLNMTEPLAINSIVVFR